MRGGPVRQPKAGKNWAYLAELLLGSPGRATQRQIRHWLKNGFTTDEFSGFSMIPGPIPHAEAWSAGSRKVQIQLRGSGKHWKRWLNACPVKSTQLTAVAFGSANADPVAINCMDLKPGACGARDLLKLAELERVWDPDPQRVQLLRQFGVRASLIQDKHP